MNTYYKNSNITMTFGHVSFQGLVESERHEDQNCRNNAACQILNEIEGFGKMGKILGKSLKLVCQYNNF